MLEQTHRLLLNELVDHVGKDGSNSVESLISLANVLKAKIIEQNLLDNEDSNGLTEFATSFHDAQAERNDLGAKPKHCRHGWKQRRVRALIDYKSIQGSLACLRVHHLRNPLEYTTVLVTDCTVTRLQLELVFVGRLHAGGRSNVVHSNAIVMLLLRSCCSGGGSGSLCLGLCLSLSLGLGLGLSVLLLQTMVRLLVVMRLLLLLLPFLGRIVLLVLVMVLMLMLVLMREDMLRGQHLGCAATATGSVVCARMHAAAMSSVVRRNVTESKYACFMIKILASSYVHIHASRAKGIR
ncbi:hypothetical protein KCU99_g166, partial [Aureobasidium melanogenum]